MAWRLLCPRAAQWAGAQHMSSPRHHLQPAEARQDAALPYKVLCDLGLGVQECTQQEQKDSGRSCKAKKRQHPVYL
jgi:hypothetical protein